MENLHLDILDDPRRDSDHRRNLYHRIRVALVGIGALAAAFAGLIGFHSITLQFLIFAIVSIALTAASRTIFVNYFFAGKDGRRSQDRHGCSAGKSGHGSFFQSRCFA